jgi:spore coat protein U-like protein
MRAALLGLAACLAAGSPAHALLCGTFLNPMTVSATAISFGDYLVTDNVAYEATGTLRLQCTLPDVLVAFTVSISPGRSTTYVQRTMKRGARTLRYNLSTTETHDTVWGNGSGGTAVQDNGDALITAAAAEFTVYGLAPAGQWSGKGAYQDTLVVTVTF